MLAAIQDCLNRKDDWDQPIGPNGKIYSSGSVTLSLYPEENMSWGEWSSSTRGLNWFLTKYEAVDLSFQIMAEGKGKLGSGKFTPLDTNVTLPFNTTSLTSSK